MINAKVKWFNVNKGYGFVEFEDGRSDAFLHYSAIEDAKVVTEGQSVLVELAEGPKGPQVTRLLDGKTIVNPRGDKR